MPITFTVNCKQRPLEDLIKELSDIIKETELSLSPRYAALIKEPTKLVGHSIKQKFLNDNQDNDGYTWYAGQVLEHTASNTKERTKYVLLISP